MNIRLLSIIVPLSLLLVTTIDFSMDYANYRDAINSTYITGNEMHIIKTHMYSSVNSHIKIGVFIIGFECLLLIAFAIKKTKYANFL
ncbi:hypothetical protein [Bacillus sp. AFS088145]|uniref:hypothetical protein n=1 Tax=Bacillus sp. AFS088145 TaxID=2033514 RepID=UPI000BF9AC71|nr:hypothetical protein [Bacillus sp. AFS088145]PFH81133.1 hypothetical protein COI44_23410 [Bacillus sp. AFS088145]